MRELVKIDKGIPIPKNLKSRTNKKYPIENMQIGDSIIVRFDKPETVSSMRSDWRKRTGFDFVYAAVKKGHRVWRIK